ncbi:hypothetical protein SUDANB171_02307 [Streptomyces sp. enrichment culture]|jgi:AcrR family transcriptional regulator|uniref:TetR/AcrR family transcriptional regulator n=1 Tax=Streptomyces xiamenensis TaxID=408015 RepID=UPI0036E35B12
MTTTHSSGGGDISRSLRLMWEGRESPNRGPKPGLTLDGIVAAAIELADREGLSALSMRKVAAELGVGTMTLYRYVPAKEELLDLMLDQVNGPDPGQTTEHFANLPWRTCLSEIAHGSYATYLRHPWLLQVNQSRPLLGPNALLGFENSLTALRSLPLTGQEKVLVITTLDAFVTGLARTHVLAQQLAEQSAMRDEEFWNAQAPLMETALNSGAYPEVFALPDNTFDITGEETFAFGLDRVLDGLEVYFGRPDAAGDPDPVSGNGCG